MYISAVACDKKEQRIIVKNYTLTTEQKRALERSTNWCKMTCNLTAMLLSKHGMCTMSVMGLKGAKQALDPDIVSFIIVTFLKFIHLIKVKQTPRVIA